ncbi:MAG: hypothetical protein JW936_03450 [Sedimentisphaerales bacterium]|nr:hypothetical protein [Sedimentisphaerales bacterium]
MDTRTWLTSNPKLVVEGKLDSICLRLFAVWALLSMPFMIASAMVWRMLTPSLSLVAVVLLAVPCMLYVYFVVQGIRVFLPAPDKKTDSNLFLILQVVVYVSFFLALWRDSKDYKSLEDNWSMLGFILGAIMALLNLAFITIAASARQKVAIMTWTGLIVSLVSCAQYIRGQLL